MKRYEHPESLCGDKLSAKTISKPFAVKQKNSPASEEFLFNKAFPKSLKKTIQTPDKRNDQ
jgi:hypothetical protein